MTPRRLICSPMFGTASNLPPITIDGWENVTLFNYGEGPKPILKPGTDLSTPGTRLHDWEYGKPREVRREWATLLRAAKPGDIALGVNTFVNDDRWDDAVGMTANIMRGTGVSLTTEFYVGQTEKTANWESRWEFRWDCLRDVKKSTGNPSTFTLTAWTGRDYAAGSVWGESMFGEMLSHFPKPSAYPFILFAPAATPEARAKVEAATRVLAGLIGGVTQ